MLVAQKETAQLAPVGHIPLVDLPVDDMWRAQVRARMKELGIGQAELGKHVESTQSNISQTLSLKNGQARALHAQRISEALGVAMPILARAEIAAIALIEADETLAESMISSWAAVAASKTDSNK